MRDFTLTKYECLIQAIKDANYLTSTVYDFLKCTPEKCIILRHDVDRAVNRNLEMAKLEHHYGIKSTYYFRHVEETFKPEIIRQIAKMGHEVGFHYEVMDKSNGNLEIAIEIFKKELEDLRKITEINTVCMHGNPLASWSNLDLWEKFDYRNFGIIGEPYLSINYDKVLYLTDTGRTWDNHNIRVKDVIKSKNQENIISFEKITSTDDIIELIRKEKIPQICILTHPNRWCDNLTVWAKELIFQKIKNVGKSGIIWYRNHEKDIGI